MRNNFPDGVWLCGSLVWNRLTRGQGPWLVSPCNVSFSPLETCQLIFRGGSVPRKLFVMMSLLAFVCKLPCNWNVSIQNLKRTGFVQPEVQMRFSLGSWQDLLSHLSNWHSNQRSKNTTKIWGGTQCLEKPWQECYFSFPPVIKFIYASEQTSAWSISGPLFFPLDLILHLKEADSTASLDRVSVVVWKPFNAHGIWDVQMQAAKPW